MVNNNCMEKYEESGACLAEDDQALDLTGYDLVQGDWWTVYGQSCGQVNQNYVYVYCGLRNLIIIKN